MTRGLTDEEKRLIADAVNGGQVTTIEPVSSKAESIKLRRETVKSLFLQGMTNSVIAERLGVSVPTVSLDMRVMGLRRRRKGRPAVTLSEKKAQRAEKKVGQVKDRRRFKTVPVPMGDPSRVVATDKHDTLFPDRVFDVGDDEPVLKDGCHQSKIGGDVLVGWLKGARIVTLTLEERVTCPTSCFHYRSCYGNAMPYARRWRHGPDLEDRLRKEVADLCRRFERVLVRLHILGDFYSTEYVNLWAEFLSEHPGLHVFGFTAHKEGSEIGDYIAAVRRAAPDRFFIRHSNMTGPWGSFTLDFPTQQKMTGDAVVCPEQRDAMNGAQTGRHCGNCGVCWSSGVPIVFVTH